MPSRPVSRVTCVLGTAIPAAGLALAGYLTALKWFGLPCTGAGCGAVIGSTYGVWLGLPVGLYALAGWLLAVLWTRARPATYAALALGSLYFTCVQLFVLRAFCPWCLAHAALCGLALLFRTPSRHAAWIGLLLATLISGLAWQTGHQTTRGTTATAEAGWFDQSVALDWLGPTGDRSAVLVLSLTCPACLDLLDEASQADAPRGADAPAIFLKTTPQDRKLAVQFVAAVQSLGGGHQAFQTALALLLAQRDLVLAQPDFAAAWLAEVLPAAPGQTAAAELRLTQGEAVLAAADTFQTPRLFLRDGTSTTRIRPADLWSAAP